MKNMIRSFFTVLLAFGIFSASGCAPVKMYDGPRLPRNKIAIIVSQGKIAGISIGIATIDGKEVGPRWCEILPGSHTISVTCWSRHYGLATPVFGGSKIPYTDYFDTKPLTFYAYAGHTYMVRALGDCGRGWNVWIQDKGISQAVRVGRFIAYDNGTVKDTMSGLMWAAKDNGKDITWHDAKRYCENYRGGGYSDWRMPTTYELKELYDKNEPGYRLECYNKAGFKVHITKLIHLSCCCPWASETRGSEAATFTFYNGIRYWFPQYTSHDGRALPVRSGN